MTFRISEKSKNGQRISVIPENWFIHVLSWRQQKQQCLFSLLRFFDELYDVINDDLFLKLLKTTAKIIDKIVKKINFLNIINLFSTSTKWIHKLIYLCGCSTILWIGMTTQSAGLFTIRTWKNWRLWFHCKPQTRNSGIEITVIPGNNFFKDYIINSRIYCLSFL